MMESTNKDVLPCLLALLRKFSHDGVTCAWLMAAAVDLINEQKK